MSDISLLLKTETNITQLIDVFRNAAAYTYLISLELGSIIGKDTMSSSLHRHSSLRESSSFRSVWLGRLIVSLTALVWIALGGAIFWIIGHAIGAVILLCIAAILAYAIFPLVKILQRILPRPIAILIVYVVILSGLCFLIYFTAISTVAQLNALIPFLQALFQPGKPSPIQPFLDLMISPRSTTNGGSSNQGKRQALDHLTPAALIATLQKPGVPVALRGEKAVSILCLRGVMWHNPTLARTL